jgi:glycine/D-amino acid oxidase-like deaminating enzyme
MAKVVVIGGGWAGCAAAITAKKAGAEVVILEKTDLLIGLGNVGGIFRNNGRYTAAEEAIALGARELFEVMDENEYRELMEYIEELKETILHYRNTAGAVLQSIIQDLPKNAQAAADIVQNFNPKQYQAVIDFATAANGGRNIETNR